MMHVQGSASVLALLMLCSCVVVYGVRFAHGSAWLETSLEQGMPSEGCRNM